MKTKDVISKFNSVPPALWMILIALVIFSFFSPKFFEFSNFRNILIQASPLLIVSIGVTIVILTEGIDLSTGSIISLVSVLLIVYLRIGIPIYLSIPLALLSAALLGAINGVVISKAGVPPFIATLGMSSIASGVALVITQGSSIYFYHRVFSRIVNTTVLTIPTPIIIGGLIFFISWILLYKTRFGAQVFGLGGNVDALILGGINKDWSIIKVYAYSGLLAGATGIIIASRIESGNPIAGVGWEFDAIAASLIGGTSFSGGRGGIGGTVLGAFFLAVIRNALNVIGISSMYQSALIGGIVLFAIVVDVYVKGRQQEMVEV